MFSHAKLRWFFWLGGYTVPNSGWHSADCVEIERWKKDLRFDFFPCHTLLRMGQAKAASSLVFQLGCIAFLSSSPDSYLTDGIIEASFCKALLGLLLNNLYSAKISRLKVSPAMPSLLLSLLLGYVRSWVSSSDIRPLHQ